MEPDNNSRAYWALKALHEFMRQTGAERDYAIQDLMTDLMHLVRADGDDPEDVVRRAAYNFKSEEYEASI